jgi:hypothetical protein
LVEVEVEVPLAKVEVEEQVVIEPLFLENLLVEVLLLSQDLQ